MSDESLEKEIQEKGLTAPRISLAHVQGMLRRVEYRYDRPEDTRVTFCHAFLDGEFFLGTGTSACISAENFDAEFGRKAARQEAQQVASDKLYELEGYLLWVATGGADQ